MWLEVFPVTPDGPEHVSGEHGLGGRLIRTIDSWNHRGVGGLAIKALCLLVIPHAQLFYLSLRPAQETRVAEMNSDSPLSSENSQAENNNNLSTKNKRRYHTSKLQPCYVWPADPVNYIHLSVVSGPVPGAVQCSNAVVNRAERARTIATVLMAVSIFHSFWMQNVMLLRVSALQTTFLRGKDAFIWSPDDWCQRNKSPKLAFWLSFEFSSLSSAGEDRCMCDSSNVRRHTVV